MKIKRLLIFTCCISLLLTMPTSAISTNHAPSVQPSTETLYIYSDECPTEIYDYATEHFLDFLIASIESGSISIPISSSSIWLGSPFSIASLAQSCTVFYFPVISDNTVIATFRVYIDQARSLQTGSTAYSGIMSPYLAPEINSLRTRTTEQTPALLFIDNNNVMLTLGNTTELFLPNPSGVQPIGMTAPHIESRCIQIYTPIALVSSNSLVSTASISKYLSLSLIETQGANNWCGAYSTAAIIRYYLNNPSTPTALDLMTLISAGSNPDQTFSLSNSMIIGWNYFGVNFIYVDGTINAIAQIDNNKPVYVYGYDYTNEEAHAFVIRGYNISGNVYSVWNPWHSYYESMNMSTLTFAANSSQIYTWTQTLYIGNSL